MAVEDWVDFSDDWDETEPRERDCWRCGAEELHWEEARGPHNEKRWVLVERSGSIHCCPEVRPAEADEFPIEPEPPDGK